MGSPNLVFGPSGSAKAGPSLPAAISGPLNALGLAELQPQGATNFRLQLIIGASGLANAPAITVPPGAYVTLSGIKGQAVNSGDVWVGTYPEELNNAGRLVAPGLDVIFPVDNTASIWVKGAVNDGLQINVVMPKVG